MVRALPSSLLAIGLAFAAAVPLDPVSAATPAAAPTPAAAASSGAAAVPDGPQQTTATFADWVLRCNRLAAGEACELVQTVSRDNQPVAEIALGRIAKGQPLRLTVLVPTSVTFGRSPALVMQDDRDPPLLTLAWRRCLPIGCFADAAAPDEVVRVVRGWTDAAKLTYADGAARPVSLPFSPRGLGQALDALARQAADSPQAGSGSASTR